MSIESRVEKSDGYVASRESFVRVHSQRRRQDKLVLFEDRSVRLNLFVRASEKFHTALASLNGVVRPGVWPDDCLQIGRQCGERTEVVLHRAITDRTDGPRGLAHLLQPVGRFD